MYTLLNQTICGFIPGLCRSVQSFAVLSPFMLVLWVFGVDNFRKIEEIPSPMTGDHWWAKGDLNPHDLAVTGT